MPLLRQKPEHNQYSTSDVLSHDEDEKFLEDVLAAANRHGGEEASAAEILAALDDQPSNRNPALVATPTDALTDDEVEAVAALDVQDQRAALAKRSRMIRDAQADKTRRRTRNRVRLHRAKLASYGTLVAKLRQATAKPRGDKLLEQLRGQEPTLALFCFVEMTVARSGLSLSAAGIAEHYERITGDKITRLQAHRYRERVALLKVEGGPWHGL